MGWIISGIHTHAPPPPPILVHTHASLCTQNGRTVLYSRSAWEWDCVWRRERKSVFYCCLCIRNGICGMAKYLHGAIATHPKNRCYCVSRRATLPSQPINISPAVKARKQTHTTHTYANVGRAHGKIWFFYVVNLWRAKGLFEFFFSIKIIYNVSVALAVTVCREWACHWTRTRRARYATTKIQSSYHEICRIEFARTYIHCCASRLQPHYIVQVSVCSRMPVSVLCSVFAGHGGGHIREYTE